MTLAATEEHSGFDPPALALSRLRHLVLRDQYVIGVSHAKDFHAHQPKRNHHGVTAIHSDRVDRLVFASEPQLQLALHGPIDLMKDPIAVADRKSTRLNS